MKIVIVLILWLALIAFGSYSLISRYKRRFKEKRKIINLLALNYLIATDSLRKLSAEGKIEPEEYYNSIEYLSNNNNKIIEIVYKTDAIENMYEMLQIYHYRFEQKMEEEQNE